MSTDKKVTFKDDFNPSTVEALNLIKGRPVTDTLDKQELREYGIRVLECADSKHGPLMIVAAIELDLDTDSGLQTSFALFKGRSADQSTGAPSDSVWFQATKVVTLEGSYGGEYFSICYDKYIDAFAVCLEDSEEKKYVRIFNYDEGCWQVGKVLLCSEDPKLGEEMSFRNTENGLPYWHLCVVGERDYIFEFHTLGFADFSKPFHEVTTNGSATEVDPDVQNTPGFSLAGIEGRIAELEIAFSNREEHIAKESKILVREQREMYLLKELLALRES